MEIKHGEIIVNPQNTHEQNYQTTQKKRFFSASNPPRKKKKQTPLKGLEWPGSEAVLMSGSGSTIFCLGDPATSDFEAETKERFDIEGIWKTKFMRGLDECVDWLGMLGAGLGKRCLSWFFEITLFFLWTNVAFVCLVMFCFLLGVLVLCFLGREVFVVSYPLCFWFHVLYLVLR